MRVIVKYNMKLMLKFDQSWQHFLIYIYFIFYTFNPINDSDFWPFRESFSKIFSKTFSMFNPSLLSAYLSLLMILNPLSSFLPYLCAILSLLSTFHYILCHICSQPLFCMNLDCKPLQTVSSIQECLWVNVCLYYSLFTCAVIYENASICCFQVPFD